MSISEDEFIDLENIYYNLDKNTKLLADITDNDSLAALVAEINNLKEVLNKVKKRQPEVGT